MDTKKVIELLNKALTTEYQAIIQYRTHAAVVMGIDSDTVIPVINHIAEEEEKHAEMLRQRIFWLGGTPTMEVDKRVFARAIKDILKVDIKAEEGAVKLYTEILKMIPMHNAILFETVEHILKDEQEHIEELTRLKG